jgi:hypothetical protein
VKLYDLPLSLAQSFGNENLWMGKFASPTDNPLLGVQFVSRAGKRTHINGMADNVYFDEPLSGPFYQLPVSGLLLLGSPRRLRKSLVAISHVDGVYYQSAPFAVQVSIRKMKEYTTRNGMKWYYFIDTTSEWVSFDGYESYVRGVRRLERAKRQGSVA